ncbi:phosphonate metabolism transcriptional regulator PhnF [Rhizobium miluonense]|uniref:GntR family transcriptional regulator, phosphonate transport system regulatory protein n=1 Tax=Rhizobium miluonense TaxID=411945 RepID=A0A1C3WD01_9HYPH|nr:phosphonate metabolism transcriptional regulator PhnF [Rhizobium miluonense]SCB38027.1 GntR family transcriptional regulator, phosphonate transport system regulatory protein [Rhizobium miluonense]
MASSGMALWRQIGETLAEEIERGDLLTNQRLPSSEVLAARFGVNRHTVLKAIGHLQAEGKVRIERGRGAYAVVNPLQYNVGPHQLFEQNLVGSNLVPSRAVLSVVECYAPGDVAEALQLPKGQQILLVTILGEASGAPLNFGSHYFANSRLPGIEGLFRALEGKGSQQFSFLSLFRQCGVDEYRRKDVRIRSRMPSNDEARHLNIPAVEYVLTTLVVGVGPAQVPLTYAETSFASSRVELKMEF